MENQKVTDMARNMVGDGKLPNKYFVSINNSYLYYSEESEALEGINDAIQFTEKGGTIAMFDTYQKARDFIEANYYLGMETDDFTVNTIEIEDRLSGQIYEQTRIFYPASGEIKEETHEDIRFTEETMVKRGAKFV